MDVRVCSPDIKKPSGQGILSADFSMSLCEFFSYGNSYALIPKNQGTAR